jgi:galactoside O-acetyltransferase
MPDNKNIFFDFSELAGLGEHAIVGKTVRIRKPTRVTIGDHSIIDDFTYISCGLTVGRYTHIGANGVLIGGDAHITIGNFVNVAPGCRIIAASNDFSGGGLVGPTIPPEFAGEAVTENITIGDHALFGTGAIILPGCQVPEGVSVGAMSLVTPGCRLEPWTLYAGVPAKPVKKRDSQSILEAAQRLLANEQKQG